MTGNLNRKRIVAAKRIVIKIGSILLVDGKSGRLHRDWLEALAKDIAEWRARGQEIILVSSGAVALGRRYLDLKQGELRLEEKQAAAAAGMVRLSHAYQETLEQHELNVAQILLTLDARTDAVIECPHNHQHVARGWSHSSHQRKRHGSYGRNPFWR